MKYYRLERSVDTKEIGRHAIQLTFADKKSQDSCWSLVDEEFPNFKPDLRFDLERGAKLTDVVSSGVDVPGFMINERVKNIFEQCKLPDIGIMKQLLQIIRELFTPIIVFIFCLMIIL